MEKKYKKFLPLAATAVVVAIVFFYVGMNYGKQSATTAQQSAYQQFRGQRTGAGMNGGGLVAGQVLSKDAQSITVQMRDGSSRIVFYSSSTPVIKPVSGSVKDISTGMQVTISGTQNSDGSITAQSIQVRQSTSTNVVSGQ